MLIQRLAALVGAGLFVFSLAAPAQALTMKECSAKYKAAKAAGTLKGMKWNDFRKSECAATTTSAKPAKKATKTSSREPTAKTKYTKEPAAPTTRAPSGVTFPRGVSSKYAKESPGKARMHTCLDAYKQNKAKGTLNGLTWIKKGGGYYSICNARLKK